MLDMARRSILFALFAAAAALFPANVLAATAPAAAPVLTSKPYAAPFTIHWTPASDPLDLSQSVYRATGACTDPPAAGGLITTFQGNATTDYTGRPVDGTYCYHIRVADLLTTADGPGVTVSVDTTPPAATVAVSGQSPTGVVSGVVGVTGTSADVVSGVASSVFHVGAPGACAAGPVLGAVWDTSGLANGAYDVCNVVTDNAGLTTTATDSVTIANLQPLALAVPVPVPIAAGPAGAVASGAPLDKLAPRAPTKLTAVLPRSRKTRGTVAVTLRWKNPVAPDLDRVVAVLNLRRAPRGPGDGRTLYRGLRPWAGFRLHAGGHGYVALFAYDHGGNVSRPARLEVSLASLIPLRPLTGSVVPAAPLLSWKPEPGTAYYNVQLFHNGKRVLVDWPSRPSYRIPSGKLEPGTYVWYVWPAIRHKGAIPTFGTLIGRATFVFRA
jgi:hypothetical protein